MAGAAKEDTDLPDAWLLGLWLILSFMWFLVSHGYTPTDHVAYWRESTSVAALLGLLFTVLLGFARPAGWLGFLSMAGLIYFLPEALSGNLSTFFWVAYYFTVVFCAGSSLTLRKMAKICGISGLLIGYGMIVDPNTGLAQLGQGMLVWLSLFPVMMVFNALLRLVRRPDLKQPD